MRKGLLALNLEAPEAVVDDMTRLCERAILAVDQEAFKRGFQSSERLYGDDGPEVQAGGPGCDVR